MNHKTNLNKVQSDEIIQNGFSCHSGIKPEISNTIKKRIQINI